MGQVTNPRLLEEAHELITAVLNGERDPEGEKIAIAQARRNLVAWELLRRRTPFDDLSADEEASRAG